jgi:hypothetical protein
VLRATAVLEEAGIPAVPIFSSGFEAMARAVARGLGIAHVPVAVYQGVIPTDSDDEFERKMIEQVTPAVIASLTERTGHAADAETTAEPAMRDVAHTGDLDSVQEFFLRRGWSDGLPIIPPTEERVEAALRFTDRDPGEVIGSLAPEHREATVWNVAVNGVMAGCRPEYLPVLLAIVEVLADPQFRIEDAGSTPGWEPLVVISGPLVTELDFNFGTGALRAGRQANTSIGRFVRLYMRNVAGLRIPPSETDQGALGYTFNVVLAEDEDAVTGVGWPPYRVDKGFALDESAVTVRSVVTIGSPIYSAGSRASDHLATLAEFSALAMGPWFYLGLMFSSWHPLLVLNPSIARAIAEDGAGKDAIRQYLFDNVKTTAAALERCAHQVGHTDFDLQALVAEGHAPAEFAESGDPERLVRMALDPECLDVVVAGSPARNQSRMYVQNHAQGVPTSRRVELPANWADLLAGGR